MRGSLAAVLSLLVSGVAVAGPQALPEVHSGDVVLQTSRSGQSEAIQRATKSPYSHVGIVEVTDEGAFVIEAIGKVSRTPWKAWKRRGLGGKVTILRPHGLDVDTTARVVGQARALLGKRYDAKFGWGDDRIYCSELVYKAFERGAGVKAGRLQRVRDLDLTLIEKAVVARYGKIPWDLELVTPDSVAHAPVFDRVYSDFPNP